LLILSGLRCPELRQMARRAFDGHLIAAALQSRRTSGLRMDRKRRATREGSPVFETGGFSQLI